ncbi:protein of unknown function [Legionella longbeachae NSW150]|uniref:Uncharacterized protein n=1 Tax=Legionella longbeachae serogroup 1 (strain NSW150) TaxID=661367 RepID=D3HKQ5_LEGLN|nr:protein of unknown function [Legionella longbeachae NSW150]
MQVRSLSAGWDYKRCYDFLTFQAENLFNLNVHKINYGYKTVHCLFSGIIKGTKGNFAN